MKIFNYILLLLVVGLVVFRVQTTPRYLFFNKYEKVVEFHFDNQKECFENPVYQWIKKEKEFIFNGFLYDVKTIVYEKSGIKVIAFEDKSETEWYAQQSSKLPKAKGHMMHFESVANVVHPQSLFANYFTINHISSPKSISDFWISINLPIHAPPPQV